MLIFTILDLVNWSKVGKEFVPGHCRQFLYIYIFIEVSQVGEELVPGRWILHYSWGELRLIINAIRLNKTFWLLFIIFFSNSSYVGVLERIIPNFFTYSFCKVFDGQVGKLFGKKESSDDITHLGALVRGKWVGFKNLSLCLSFSFRLFFNSSLQNLAEFSSVVVSSW